MRISIVLLLSALLLPAAAYGDLGFSCDAVAGASYRVFLDGTELPQVSPQNVWIKNRQITNVPIEGVPLRHRVGRVKTVTNGEHHVRIVSVVNGTETERCNFRFFSITGTITAQ